MTSEQYSKLSSLFEDMLWTNSHNTHNTISEILELINSKLGYKINSEDYYLPQFEFDFKEGDVIECAVPED